jgi:CRP/FNR family cyclic AMP-dependent transcriptional regulator
MSSWTKENFSFQDLQQIMFKLIQRVEVFKGLTQQELVSLLGAADKCTFKTGDVIVKQGSTGAFLYVIVEGQVSVTKTVPPKPPVELAKLDPGSSFGEMSLVDQELRSASVIASRPCTLLRLNETACWANPGISAKIFRNIARIVSVRLRSMDEAYVLTGDSSRAEG